MYVEVKSKYHLDLLNGYLRFLNSVKYFELNTLYKVINKKHFPIMGGILEDKTYMYELEEYNIIICEQILYSILVTEKPLYSIHRINFSSTMFKIVKKDDENS